MPVAVLHKKIDSLPNAYVEKVSEYVEFLLWNLNTNTKTGNSVEEKKAALANMEKYRGRLHLPENFDYKKEMELALQKKHGYISRF